MRMKFIGAALAAAATFTALPAAAEHDRNRDRDGWYGGRRPAEITVRSDRGSFTVDRGDRLYWRLKSNPFKFKDGHIYEYGRCFRGGCDVLVIDPYGRQRFNRIVAPSVDRYFGRGNDRRRW